MTSQYDSPTVMGNTAPTEEREGRKGEGKKTSSILCADGLQFVSPIFFGRKTVFNIFMQIEVKAFFQC